MKCQGIPLFDGSASRTSATNCRDITSLIDCCRSNQERDFTANDCTRAEVWRMAAALYDFKPGPICLCSTDKKVLAAALLSGFHGGPKLILPYAFSAHALREAYASIPYSFVLGNAAVDFPHGVRIIDTPLLSETGNLPTKASPPDTPFIWLFTGGSTGKPRMWSKSAINLLGEAAVLTSRFAITPDDILLSTVPPQHIYGLLFSVLIPLLSGCSVLAPVFGFPQEIITAASRHHATILVSVPVHYHILRSDSLKRHCLKRAFSSAGVLNEQDAAFFHQRTGLPITEILGSTETGGIAWRQLPTGGFSWQPLDGVRWKIVDGRLVVDSGFLSPELPRNNGFFTTSDRAAPSAEATFTLQGRADDIVKVGGKRVDLVEVCTRLKQLEGVDDAIVFVLHNRIGRGSELAAFVAGSSTPALIRQGLAAVCEPHAIPRHIRAGDSIPVLPSGKYDRELIKNLFSPAEDKEQD